MEKESIYPISCVISYPSTIYESYSDFAYCELYELWIAIDKHSALLKQCKYAINLPFTECLVTFYSQSLVCSFSFFFFSFN